MSTFTRTFSAGPLAPGLGTALEYEVVSTDKTTVLVSRRNTGITEWLGSGVYEVSVILDTSWSGFIRWTTGSGAVPEAQEEFQALDASANALLDLGNAVETGWTVRMLLRILGAVLGGKLSGAGSNAPAFRSLTDAKTRVTMATDSLGNRSGVTLDGS